MQQTTSDDDIDRHAEQRRAEQQRAEGNACLSAGVGIGAVGLAGGLLLGATCPLCVVATPALLGVGVYKRLQARRAGKPVGEPHPEDETHAAPDPA